jgi:DNA-binding SARP family transcriptional activator
LLGRFQVWRGGEPIPEAAWRRPKVAALFQWLCLQEGRPVSRGEVMEAFWGDLAMERASRNLATTLSTLRGALGPLAFGCLVGDAHTLQLLVGDAVWVDAMAFEQQMRAAARYRHEGDGPSAERCFRQALALYQGELLPCHALAEWVLPHRAHLARLRLRALAALAEQALAQGDAPEAEALAWQVLEQEPCDEVAVRVRMEALRRQGRRTEALRYFQQFRRELRRELSAAPEAATIRVVDRLRLSPR